MLTIAYYNLAIENEYCHFTDEALNAYNKCLLYTGDNEKCLAIKVQAQNCITKLETDKKQKLSLSKQRNTLRLVNSAAYHFNKIKREKEWD